MQALLREGNEGLYTLMLEGEDKNGVLGELSPLFMERNPWKQARIRTDELITEGGKNTKTYITFSWVGDKAKLVKELQKVVDLSV